QVRLLQFSGSVCRDQRLVESELATDIAFDSRLRDEGDRGLRTGLAKCPEHRAVMYRLRRGNGGIRVSHRGGRDYAALQNQRRLHSKKSRLPQHHVGKLAYLD